MQQDSDRVLADKIKELYFDKTFPGSYSGISNFLASLKLHKNISISKKRLANILAEIPDYTQNARTVKRWTHRHYDVANFGSLFQADLGLLPAFDGYTCFLCVVGKTFPQLNST